jgi:hypothetical protein
MIVASADALQESGGASTPRAATIEHMSVWQIWHSVYDAFYSLDVPKGAMALYEVAATWGDRAEVDRVWAQLNEQNNGWTLDTLVNPWIVTVG